jgi:uncharacterized protein (TIGR04222 family)
VLGRELHHEPSQGGSAESNKFRGWYEQTLASYEQHFGERPPADLWPPTSIRFAAAGRSRWIDTSKYYLLRKSAVLLSGIIVFLIGSAVILEGCAAAASNPFNFAGPDFLALYVGMMIAGLLTGIAIRCLIQSPADENAPILNDPYAVAYLSNGHRGVVIAALASLVQKGCLEVVHWPKKPFKSARPGSLVRKQKLDLTAPEIEQRIYDAVPDRPLTTRGDGILTSKLIRAVQSATKGYEKKLRAAGLIQPSDREPALRKWLPFLVMVGVIVFGLVKIGVGVSRDKPVGFLIALVVLSGIIALVFAARWPTSPAGRRVLDRLRGEHRPRKSFESLGTSADYHNLVLTVGLFGMASLASEHQFDPLYTSLRQDRFLGQDGNIASQSGGGCGGSACGGGGCGGGGCGGGCGGCGS